MKPTELLALAKADLACFAIASFPRFELAAHLRAVVDQLEAVERGEVKRLIICMPPRHGKSLLTTVLFVAWYLSRHPDRQVISASYGQELADDFGRKVRNHLAGAINQTIFPACRLSGDSSAAHRFGTTAGGAYFAVGRGAAITGRGADLLVIDDLLKDREEADSATVRRQVQQWFAEVAFTRLQPQGAIVIISTRWHEDDLVGWLLREHPQEGWKVLSLPAIAETDEPFRREGEALWRERFPLEALESARALLGSGPFASLYQQRPVALEGAVFKRRWWCFREAPRKVKRVVLSFDTAFGIRASNDYSVCTVWGEVEDGWHLLFVWKARVEFPDLKRKVAELAASWNATVILVEESAAGQPLIQELKRETTLPILGVKVKGDKLTRAHAVTPLIEAGKVFLPPTAPWLDDVLDEVSTFPSGVHDDIVDSLTQALIYLRERQSPSILPFLDAFMSKPAGITDPYLRAQLVELPEGHRTRPRAMFCFSS